MKLCEVALYPNAVNILWRLLEERPPEANISHRRMPTWEDHCRFVFSAPYNAWYIIEVGDWVGKCPAGATYLTDQNEIGIGIFRQHQSNGYATAAIKMLMDMHKAEPRFLANIAPGNARSIGLFQNLGFGLIQQTYERRHAN